MSNCAIEFLREDYCMECNKSSIELYNIRNQPMGYSKILDNSVVLDNIINTTELSHFQCKTCGIGYGIHWLKPEFFPIPLRNVFILDNFEENKLGKNRL